jgi:hypothetical protein
LSSCGTVSLLSQIVAFPPEDEATIPGGTLVLLRQEGGNCPISFKQGAAG